ncbi:SMC domain protein [Solidesulfovibrio fructosivorans JJ]]|uniref:SMC domain protein n=1 Tax=Solidesulfovibrio fructosivorans JJ] TaxID=596151 RepID=E1JQY9_SOLFR|nr:ATP-binding protein [Solidesulfovibrio fructosivorans]EFL52990.1 SMC domain protein [Solidesulfovibrio fructosivorans JJ]]
MIDKIKIVGFKSLSDVSIDLGKVNVFIGANGSGKSNILEAIGVMSAAASGKVDDESLMRRGVRPGLPRLYKSSFKNIRTPPHIFFLARSKMVSYSIALNNPLTDPQLAWSYKTENFSQNSESIISRGIRDSKKYNKYQGLAALKMVEMESSNYDFSLLESLNDYAIYCPNTPTLRGTNPDLQQRAPVGLSGGRLAEALRELQSYAMKNDEVQDYLDEMLYTMDWFSNVDTMSSASSLLSPSVPRSKYIIRFTDRFMDANRNTLTAYDASEGALYVIFLAVLALSQNAPSIFAIDNLDQALNPRLIRAVVKTFCQLTIDYWEDQQILFTSHNPLVLDGLPLESDDIRLFAVNRNNFGHTQVKRIKITDEMLKLCNENSWPLSRLWTMGHIGGVPNV